MTKTKPATQLEKAHEKVGAAARLLAQMGETFEKAAAYYAAARRLLLALNCLDVGSDNPGFAGWQNGNGEPVGDEVEAARAELAALLDVEYPAPQPIELDDPKIEDRHEK